MAASAASTAAAATATAVAASSRFRGAPSSCFRVSSFPTKEPLQGFPQKWRFKYDNLGPFYFGLFPIFFLRFFVSPPALLACSTL